MDVNMVKDVVKIAILSLLVSANYVACQDRTRQADQGGTDLVFSILDQITQSGLFSAETNLLGSQGLLGRTAWIESMDGTDPNTYRAGFDGGIWQVEDAQFIVTQNTAALSDTIIGIQNYFNIIWSTLTWNDLRTPLYSGLAAGLYYSTISETIPQTISDQARYWKQYYDDSPSSVLTQQSFIDSISALPAITVDTNCPSNQQGSSSSLDRYALLSWAAPSNAIRASGAFVSPSDGIYVAPGRAVLFETTYTNSAGTSATCPFTVSGALSGGPVITYCPSNLKIYAEPGSTYAIVSWATPVAGTAQISYRTRHPDETSFFLIGNSIVQYNFEERDINNVVTGISVCAFVVSVLPAPTTTAPIEGDLSGQGTCGYRPLGPEPRIVSGTVAPAGSWPWIGSLQELNTPGSHSCGATLIRDRWAVTAAHCFIFPATDTTSTAPTAIVFGDNSLTTPNAANVQSAGYTEVFPYPGYSPDSPIGELDLALIYLDTAIQTNDNVQPMCLATNTQEGDTYSNCQTAGWGALTENGQYPETLYETPLPLITTDACQNTPYFQNPTDNIICAGGENDNPARDTCQGDSGGPLICRSTLDNSWHLVGVVSTGDGCGRPQSPGFYTRISQFAAWIEDTITTTENL